MSETGRKKLLLAGDDYTWQMVNGVYTKTLCTLHAEWYHQSNEVSFGYLVYVE
jgi:hypothetical protein